MSLEFDDNYHIWKIKLQLAQQGSIQALQQIKQHCFKNTKQQKHYFIENNLFQALKNSQIKYLKENQTFGNYQLYSNIPLLLLLQGQLQLKCLNLEGDQQLVQTYKQESIILVNKQKISQKFGESNVNIVTKFNFNVTKKDQNNTQILNRAIFIEIDSQSRKKIESNTNGGAQKVIPSQVGLRQQAIMKKYMLFPLKYIRIQQYDTKIVTNYDEKFYLLEGRACFYFHKGKQRYLLSVYEEGYLNPKQFQNTDIKLYLFSGAKVLIFQEQFLRDDAIAGVQKKRTQHLNMIISKISKMTLQQRRKIQIKLINNYQLQKKVVQRQILGIIQKQEMNLTQKLENVKRISTNKDLISTSSSIKQKCRIRISKKSSRKVV